MDRKLIGITIFKIFKILLSIITILVIPASSQSPVTSSSVNNGTESISVPIIHLNLCNDTENVSSTYCTCQDMVLSCDFSAYPGPEKAKIQVHGQLIKPSVKRLCLCNTPKNVLIDLRDDFLNRNNGIHRIDLYNLNGPLHFNGAFSLNFSGDLYMANISYLKSINHWEFGRGFDMQIEDVQDLECCSKIQVPQNYNRPILFLQDTTIGTILSNGITGLHRWKTIIMNVVKNVHYIEHNGIKLGSENINVSFTACQFTNVSEYGIEIEKFENLVMTKSLINNSHPLAFMAVSNLPNSSLVIVNNYFYNVMTLQFDARWVICSSNVFDFWYHYTFEFLNVTTFSDRVFSIEYNAIENYLINDTSAIPSINVGDSVVFKENVFGKCNCSQIISGIIIPEIIEKNPSRCCNFNEMDNSDKTKGNCLIDFKSALNECKKDSAKRPNFSEMCKDPSVSVFSLDRRPKLNINSRFINEILNISDFEKSKENKIETPTTSKEIDGPTGHSSHTTLYAFLTILGVVIIAVVASFIVKRRRRPFFRIGGQSASESYDVLTTAT